MSKESIVGGVPLIWRHEFITRSWVINLCVNPLGVFVDIGTCICEELLVLLWIKYIIYMERWMINLVKMAIYCLVWKILSCSHNNCWSHICSFEIIEKKLFYYPIIIYKEHFSKIHSYEQAFLCYIINKNMKNNVSMSSAAFVSICTCRFYAAGANFWYLYAA